MTASRPTTAAEAMAVAKEAKQEIKAHEDICALRYSGINTALTDMRKIIVWGGSIAFVAIVSLLAWSLNQQYETNLQARIEAQTKIANLERQVAAERNGR